jgi:hypothetical protein
MDELHPYFSNTDISIDILLTQVWDVLSNKEAVDIVASAPGRATAARALVDCAVRAWRLKYPTSKTDDCAVVCLFLEHPCAVNGEVEEQDLRKIPMEPGEHFATDENTGQLETKEDSRDPIFMHSGSTRNSDEIVPVPELTVENPSVMCQGQSKRSLAECISTSEDEEWSALEGITRVNSLLSLPRLLSGDKRAASWRKWV